METKTRITITATSQDGRKQQVTLTLRKKVAEHLYKVAITTDSDGVHNDTYLKEALNALYEDYEMRHLFAKTELTRSQFYKLRDFYHASYNRFGHYHLTIN